MAASVDVLVIGGGIIGLTAAYELARTGLKVEVCDRSDLGREASWAGAGIIPPGNPAKAATPFDRLRAVSSSRFAKLTQTLHESTGIDPGYRVCRGIEFLDKRDAYVLDLWRDEGIEFREQPENNSMDSAIAYLLPGMAQVRNPRLLQALIAACRSLGVILSPHRPVESLGAMPAALPGHEELGTSKHAHATPRPWQPKKKIENVIFSNGERQSASHYVIASGPWCEHLLNPLGIFLGVHPVRGQIVQYRTSLENLNRIIIHGKRYIVPRGDGVVLVGSTEEPEAGFVKETTREGIKGLKQFAESLLPGLRSATIEKTWAGLRPGSRDGLPFIGFVPGYDNALAAVGHFRSGIQLSLGTATMIADLVLKRTPTVNPEPFRLDRQDQPAAKLAFRS